MSTKSYVSYEWNPSKNPTFLLDSEALGYFPIDDKDTVYTIRVERKKRSRTFGQNRLYWGYFLKASCRELRNHGLVFSSESLHKEIKGLFLVRRVKSKLTGKWRKDTGSSTELSTTEFKMLMEKTNEYFMLQYSFHIDLSISEKDLLYWESLFL